MPRADLKRLEVDISTMIDYKVLGEDVEQTFQVRIHNGSRLEVLKAGLSLIDERNGKEIYRAKPVQVSTFENIGVPHTGSILPMEKTDIVTVKYRFSQRYWTTADYLHVIVDDATVWTGNGDLHDAGHLYTKIVTTKPKNVIALFNRDPSLLKVTNSRGFIPILMSFGASDVSLAKYLVSKGAAPRTVTKEGYNALICAAMGGSPDCLDYAHNFCNIEATLGLNGRSALAHAVEEGWPASVKWLLAHGANPNVVDKFHEFPLSTAIMCGYPWAIDLLVKYKANIHQRDRSGYSLMHYAAKYPDMLPSIAKLGLSVNDASPVYKITPLMLAAWTGQTDSVTWLLNHGANLKAKDYQGLTAQSYSRRSNTLNTDRFFLEAVAAARKKK